MNVAESLFWVLDARELKGNTSTSEGFKVLHLFGNLVTLRTLLLSSVTMLHILLAAAPYRTLTLERLNKYTFLELALALYFLIPHIHLGMQYILHIPNLVTLNFGDWEISMVSYVN
jgi:hypothetical protein